MKIIVEAGNYDLDEVTGHYVPDYKFVCGFADADKAEMVFHDQQGYEFKRMYAEFKDQRVLIDGDNFDNAPLPPDWTISTDLCAFTMEVTNSQCAPIDHNECIDLIRQKLISIKRHNAALTSANHLLREDLTRARTRLNMIKEAVKYAA